MLRSFYNALMKNNILQPAILSLAIALSSPFGHAEGSEKASQGFSGRVQAGIAYVTPSFVFSLADLDGNANSYKGYELKLGLRKFAPGYRLTLSTGIGLNDYDQTHPIFDKTRKDTTYSVFGVFTLSDLLGNKSLSSSLSAGYRHRDSNIGFLDADTFLGGLTVGYKF